MSLWLLHGGLGWWPVRALPSSSSAVWATASPAKRQERQPAPPCPRTCPTRMEKHLLSCNNQIATSPSTPMLGAASIRTPRQQLEQAPHGGAEPRLRARCCSAATSRGKRGELHSQGEGAVRLCGQVRCTVLWCGKSSQKAWDSWGLRFGDLAG